jgi:asparagine synthase (glutamine-hydrolysing)
MEITNEKERFAAVFGWQEDSFTVSTSHADWAAVAYQVKGPAGALTIFGSSPRMFSQSEDKQVVALLHGQIYDQAASDSGTALIKEYRKLGPDFIHSVNGSFALLIADQEQDQIWLFTDRVNSRKVFFSHLNGKVVLSSQISDQPLKAASLDKTAVGCYLANGSMLNNHTPYQEIRTLERASIHRIEAQKISSQRYWNYEFNQAYAHITEEKLQSDFGDVLVSVIRKRTGDDNLISLSSGYDSTVILGVMGSILKPQNVSTFSYYHGKIQTGSDEAIAAKMAAVYGYPHTMVPSFVGNLPMTLQLNAGMGQGISNYCDEVDAWIKLSEHYPPPRPPLFVGDECFGGIRAAEIPSEREVLKYASIYSFETKAWLKKFIGNDLYQQFCKQTSEEIQKRLANTPSFVDLRDKKDYLFLDHRINSRVMPWRENFAGSFFDVQNPFLDNEILDFMMAVPRDLRKGKRLFRNTAEWMFPDLFQLQRARSASVASYWPVELKLQQQQLEKYLFSSGKSRLDPLISPETIQKVIRYVIARIPADPNQNLHRTWIKGARKLLGEKNKGLFPTSNEAVQSLKRILLLRQFLIETN